MAFASALEVRSIEVIVFSGLSVMDLARALAEHPLVIKPLLAAANLASRAVERDLQIKNLNTYEPKLGPEQAAAVAGYLKPFLPPYLEIHALSHLDRVEFIDKEIRKRKGQWEKTIVDALNLFARVSFKKRMFKVGRESFELDAASPEQGEIKIGIDIKRIEARRDIHKLCDEIEALSVEFNRACPRARFVPLIVCPFVEDQINIVSRLESKKIDSIFFISYETGSIETAVLLMLARLGVRKKLQEIWPEECH